MQRALEDAVARNEILRTSFQGFDELEAPLQVITDELRPTFQAHDLSRLAAAASGSRIAQIESEVRAPWDLTRAPLFRARLASLGPGEHLLWVGAPSLCADARALDNLIAALVQDLERRLEKERPDDEQLQYVDASAWLNDVLESEDTAIGRDFWRRHDLASFRDVKLPFEKRDAATVFSTHRIALELPSGLMASDESTGVEHGLLLMTCWQWLLSRLTGDNGVLVSKSYPLRGYQDLERALGVFARHLPLAGELPGSLSLRDASKRLDASARESEKWGLCFDRSRLEPESDVPRLDYPPYVFQCLDWPGPFRVGDTVFELEERQATTDRFKLALICESGGGRPRACLEFDAGLYRRDDINRMARSLETLVTDALRRPESPLEELNLLPESERRWLIDELNAIDGSKGEPPEELPIHRAIEARAREFPRRPAVVSGDESMSYADIEREANRLARRLLQMGVVPEKVVAFCLERSPAAIVTMLAILKAGGAYVPLDPKLPAARAHRMLIDSGAVVLVSREALVADWPPSTVPTLFLDRERTSIESEPGGPVESGVAAGNVAYVLFTSGSTGRPKGVAVEHRQLSNYTRAVAERIGLGPGTTFASVTTLGADLGNTSIYSALCGGGTLHLLPESCVADPDAFAEYATRHRIDVLKIVPSHLEMLLTASRPAEVLPKKLLILGGEACSWELVRRVRAVAVDLVVLNHYGPTETTIGVTTYRVPARHEETTMRTVPIGRPMSNVRAYVLDVRRRPVPVWVAGELYIGGANVARGYLQAPPAGREKFCSDPFSSRKDARMYRTGDIARVLPSGDLEFLGRADDQVKIRGYRVELGEMESALRAHPAVKDVAVVLRRESADDGRLVGYVVPKGGSSVDPKNLREFLSAELPEFMVPSAFVVLDALPRNANGKLDRAALPPPEYGRSGDATRFEDGLSQWETVVRDIWRELLHLDEMSIHDNFYDLGGHSLLAIRVVSEIGKRTGLHVSPRELVFHTLRQFAAVCQSKQAEPAITSS